MALFAPDQPPDGEELRALEAEAERLSRAADNNHVGAEHLFLALRSLPTEHEVWQVLHALRVDLDAVFAALEAESRVEGIYPKVPARLPRTPRVQRLHKLARAAARQERAPAVRALHLLYAVAEEGASVPARLLQEALRRERPELTDAELYAYGITHRLLRPHA